MTSQRQHEMRSVSLINDAQIIEPWLDDPMPDGAATRRGQRLGGFSLICSRMGCGESERTPTQTTSTLSFVAHDMSRSTSSWSEANG